MSATDPAKRIPKSIGTDAKLFGSYTLSDVGVALLPGVLVVLLVQVVLPPSLTVFGYPLQALGLPLAGLAIAAGATFVYLTPAYTSSSNWLATFVGFRRRQKAFPHDEARSVTRIERVHPGRGAIERTDGAFVGMVQVEPPVMALATDADWQRTAEAFADVCNTVVEFPVQFYATTRAFPVEDYLAHYRARLGDPDVKANPRLRTLIEQYVEWYAADLDERQTTIRDHYVVVSVAPWEVQFESESLLQHLARLPVLGLFVEAWFAPQEAERREAMFEALDDRLRRIETGLRGIEGCGTHRVDVGEATRLVAEFWAGGHLEFDDPGQIFRTRPVVGKPP